jgi:hypothetical protein
VREFTVEDATGAGWSAGTCDPSQFDWQDVPIYECASCHRHVLSGLCGCPDPKPEQFSVIKFGTPKIDLTER